MNGIIQSLQRRHSGSTHFSIQTDRVRALERLYIFNAEHRLDVHYGGLEEFDGSKTKTLNELFIPDIKKQKDFDQTLECSQFTIHKHWQGATQATAYLFMPELELIKTEIVRSDIEKIEKVTYATGFIQERPDLEPRFICFVAKRFSEPTLEELRITGIYQTIKKGLFHHDEYSVKNLLRTLSKTHDILEKEKDGSSLVKV
jgi:hypothetical protein